MVPRPAGTDGSDHQYRETVDDAYKGAPIWRAAGWLALHFTAIPVALKAAWAVAPYYVFGQLEAAPVILVVAYLLARLFWTIAQPATYNENLTYVKATNILMVVSAGMHGALLYKYHAVDVKQNLWSRRLLKHLVEENGWDQATWQTPFSYVEPMIDASLFIAYFGTAYCLHQYIMRKMAMQKKLKEKKAAQGGGAVATPAGNRPRRTPRG